MALSNLFREPRREITESALGLAVFAVFLYPDYRFALWFGEITGDASGRCPWPIGMLLGAALLALCVLALFILHWVGEGICDFLARHGVELRPKERRW